MVIKGNKGPMVLAPKKLNNAKHKEAHVQPTQYGMGDHYGTGVRAPLGRMRSGVGQVVTPKSKLRKPPKGLA